MSANNTVITANQRQPEKKKAKKRKIYLTYGETSNKNTK